METRKALQAKFVQGEKSDMIMFNGRLSNEERASMSHMFTGMTYDEQTDKTFATIGHQPPGIRIEMTGEIIVATIVGATITAISMSIISLFH